ncbi:unnamed protein product [Linum trigynum]|uniref:CCHC-type domain-containing protein n=1 Tax=Linum trigynum TaxID=586398 RepID=A0AAV2D9F6_9ROSI
MLSLNTLASSPSATSPGLSGRPPDGPALISLEKDQISSESPAQPMNFKAALAGIATETSRSKSQWTFVGTNDLEAGSFQGEPELRISENLKERLCQPWKKTLVVRLLGRSVAFSYLCSQLRWMWRPMGSLEILDLNNDTFLATFGNDQDYLKALTGGPWVVLDHYLVVHQWSPAFRTSDKPYRSVVAWVQFPELPVHFYHREILFAIGNLVGRTVKLDYHTENLERGKFARIAIELDMSKPLPTRIRLDGAWQQVLYENLPTICYSCGRIGHKEDSCPSKVPPPPLTIMLAPDQVQNSPPVAESPEVPAGYGPWMQVIRKSKSQIRKQVLDQPRYQGNRSGKNQEEGVSSGGTKGNGKIDVGKINQGTKGKVEQSKGSGQGLQGKDKGKEVLGGKANNGNSKAGLAQEWRQVEPKSKEVASAEGKGEAKASSSKPTVLSVAQPNPQASQKVVEMNNTKIQILAVPDLHLQQKENRNPNSEVLSSRKQEHKQKKTQALQPKGINLKSTKKSLQILSPGKKETHLKHKQTALPISLEAIEEFCNTAQKQTELTDGNSGSTSGDVAMGETPLEKALVATAQEGDKTTPIPTSS